MRRLLKWKELSSLAAIVVAAALLVTGCGSSSSSSSSSSPSSSSSNPSPSASGSAVATWTEADLANVTTDAALTAALPAGIQSRGVIREATDSPYPPWDYFDPATSKNPAGFDYDLAQALGKKMGIAVKVVQTPFDSIILSLIGGKNDMTMSAMYDNLEREQGGVSFVDYAWDGTSILVKKGNPSGVTNLDSLSGKTVAAMIGGTQAALLKKLNVQLKSAGKEQVTILSPSGQGPCLLAVMSGRAVAYLTDHSVAAYAAQTTNDGNTFEVLSDPAAPNGYEPAIVGIGIAAKNTQLIDTVQKALQALIDEGVYQRIVARYGLLPVQSAQVNAGGTPAATSSTAP